MRNAGLEEAQAGIKIARRNINNFRYVQAGFRKGRGTRDQIVNIHWIIEKTREFQKTPISALLTMPKPLTVWIRINCGKFFKRWEYQTT